MGGQEQSQWEAVLAAGASAQRIVPEAIAVGGTAAALHARHRFSRDTDHLLPDLSSRFGDIRERVEADPHWKTARVQPPVLILGSIDGVQVGLRQARHRGPIDTVVVQTAGGPLRVPTLDEMLGMKAYLCYARNATRDYLDFAALSACAAEPDVVASLLKSDARYGHLQSSSVTHDIAKRLADPAPFDLDQVRLDDYKALIPEWRSWQRIADTCRRFGALLGERILMHGPSDAAPPHQHP